MSIRWDIRWLWTSRSVLPNGKDGGRVRFWSGEPDGREKQTRAAERALQERTR